MIERWYYCSCGCTIHVSEIKRISHLKLKNGIFYNGCVCPKHKYGIAQQRITKCVDCGVDVYSGKNGNLCQRCPKHAKEHYLAHPKKIRKVPKKEEPKIIYSERGQYCKYFKGCHDYPGCLDCDKFYPIFKGVDPGSARNNPVRSLR